MINDRTIILLPHGSFEYDKNDWNSNGIYSNSVVKI